MLNSHLSYLSDEQDSHDVRSWNTCVLFDDGDDDNAVVIPDDSLDTHSAESSQVVKARWTVVPSNYSSLESYLTRLFDVYSKLLAVRIDLHFDYDYAASGNIALAKERLDTFFNNMRHNSLFKHKVGYVWKLEYGEKRGYHYHVALFFDGHYVQRDQWLSHQICHYWADVITKGYGTFDNCNANKNRYAHPCLGVIDHRDTEKRQQLLYALSYLVKQDEYTRQVTRVSEQSRLRTFGHGAMPSLPVSKMGRPRQQLQA